MLQAQKSIYKKVEACRDGNTTNGNEKQTLNAVALPATTACTDDANIVALGPLTWAIV